MAGSLCVQEEMSIRTALVSDRPIMEGPRSALVAGLVLLLDIAQQDRLQTCGVSDSSGKATSLLRTDLDGSPSVAIGSAEFSFTS